MEVRHDDAELEQVESDPTYHGKLDKSRVRAFRKIMNFIRNAKNETEFYQWKSLHCEKMKGNRKHQRSLRTNKQWRVVYEIEERKGSNSNICVIKEIDDYH